MAGGLDQAAPQLGQRFVLRARLGAGGMGVVYRAFDRQHSTEVALKVLRKVTGRGLYRFKREFRVLADIVHPGIAELYELHTAGDDWFLTMELVDGVAFTRWVRPRPPTVDEPTVTGPSPFDSFDEHTIPTLVRPSPVRRALARAVLDVDRLRPALHALADGVFALHRVGVLHRDLKPSNVLVEPSGRVVLLDFGLVAEVGADAAEQTGELAAVGTPVYMSPEQAVDQPLTEASDWYSVGVMLYEALTGRRAFAGTAQQVIRAKQLADPPPPSSVADGVPVDLEALCMALLARDPAERPDGREVLARLGGAPSAASLALDAGERRVFVGRGPELAVMRAALADSRERSVVVFVRGSSGIGKSALVRHFCDEIDGAYLLEGRCYERESVPYKALDGVIDALASLLLRLPPAEVEGLLPRDIISMARLFPVLRRVEAVADPPVRVLQPPDPLEVRRRAFRGLRELLANLSRRAPVILFIDDLQWGDVDSAGFLADLIHRDDAPAVLLVACYRSEDQRDSPLLDALEQLAVGSPRVPRTIDLQPLANADAAALVRAVSPGRAGTTDGIVREAAGNPLFLSELARAGDATAAAPGTRLDELIWARAAALPGRARAMLELSAVSVGPLQVRVALRAGGLGDEAGTVGILRAARLVRVRQTGGDILLEPYHDRIRAALVARLAPARARTLHRELAVALEAERDGGAAPEAEVLLEHWLAAGDTRRAAGYAATAATAAEDTLAFHRAADLYTLALSDRTLPPDRRAALLVGRAHALANAGRLDEAAGAFAEAAVSAPAAERLELKRLQLEQVLRRGRLDSGMALAEEVLAAVGLRLPRSRAGALVSILAQRVRQRARALRGARYVERDPAEIDPRELRRIDVGWSVSSSLSFVAPVIGQSLQMKLVRDALRVGEPRRVAMTMSLELGYLALAGGPSRERVEERRRLFAEVAERLGDARLRGLYDASSGIAAFLRGDFRIACVQLERGERTMRDHCAGVRWEIDLTEIVRASSLLYLGRIRELTRLVLIYLREAEERGDVYAQRGLRAWRSNVAWLAMGRPGEARSNVDSGAVGATADGFHLHHYYETLAHGQIDLYEGDAAGAWHRVATVWRPLERSMLLRIQSVRIEGQFLRGRAAIAASLAADRAGGSGRALRKIALDAARRIERERMAWGDPLAALLRALVARARGDLDQAVIACEAAERRFRDADMALHAAAARYRLGAFLGGDDGAALIRDALAWMRAEDIAEPERMVAMIAPAP